MSSSPPPLPPPSSSEGLELPLVSLAALRSDGPLPRDVRCVATDGTRVLLGGGDGRVYLHEVDAERRLLSRPLWVFADSRALSTTTTGDDTGNGSSADRSIRKVIAVSASEPMPGGEGSLPLSPQGLPRGIIVAVAGSDSLLVFALPSPQESRAAAGFPPLHINNSTEDSDNVQLTKKKEKEAATTSPRAAATSEAVEARPLTVLRGGRGGDGASELLDVHVLRQRPENQKGSECLLSLAVLWRAQVRLYEWSAAEETLVPSRAVQNPAVTVPASATTLAWCGAAVAASEQYHEHQQQQHQQQQRQEPLRPVLLVASDTEYWTLSLSAGGGSNDNTETNSNEHRRSGEKNADGAVRLVCSAPTACASASSALLASAPFLLSHSLASEALVTSEDGAAAAARLQASSSSSLSPSSPLRVMRQLGRVPWRVPWLPTTPPPTTSATSATAATATATTTATTTVASPPPGAVATYAAPLLLTLQTAQRRSDGAEEEEEVKETEEAGSAFDTLHVHVPALTSAGASITTSNSVFAPSSSSLCQTIELSDAPLTFLSGHYITDGALTMSTTTAAATTAQGPLATSPRGRSDSPPAARVSRPRRTPDVVVGWSPAAGGHAGGADPNSTSNDNKEEVADESGSSGGSLWLLETPSAARVAHLVATAGYPRAASHLLSESADLPATASEAGGDSVSELRRGLLMLEALEEWRAGRHTAALLQLREAAADRTVSGDHGATDASGGGDGDGGVAVPLAVAELQTLLALFPGLTGEEDEQDEGKADKHRSPTTDSTTTLSAALPAVVAESVGLSRHLEAWSRRWHRDNSGGDSKGISNGHAEANSEKGDGKEKEKEEEEEETWVKALQALADFLASTRAALAAQATLPDTPQHQQEEVRQALQRTTGALVRCLARLGDAAALLALLDTTNTFAHDQHITSEERTYRRHITNTTTASTNTAAEGSIAEAAVPAIAVTPSVERCLAAHRMWTPLVAAWRARAEQQGQQAAAYHNRSVALLWFLLLPPSSLLPSETSASDGVAVLAAATRAAERQHDSSGDNNKNDDSNKNIAQSPHASVADVFNWRGPYDDTAAEEGDASHAAAVATLDVSPLLSGIADPSSSSASSSLSCCAGAMQSFSACLAATTRSAAAADAGNEHKTEQQQQWQVALLTLLTYLHSLCRAATTQETAVVPALVMRELPPLLRAGVPPRWVAAMLLPLEECCALPLPLGGGRRTPAASGADPRVALHALTQAAAAAFPLPEDGAEETQEEESALAVSCQRRRRRRRIRRAECGAALLEMVVDPRADATDAGAGSNNSSSNKSGGRGVNAEMHRAYMEQLLTLVLLPPAPSSPPPVSLRSEPSADHFSRLKELLRFSRLLDLSAAEAALQRAALSSAYSPSENNQRASDGGGKTGNNSSNKKKTKKENSRGGGDAVSAEEQQRRRRLIQTELLPLVWGRLGKHRRAIHTLLGAAHSDNTVAADSAASAAVSVNAAAIERALRYARDKYRDGGSATTTDNSNNSGNTASDRRAAYNELLKAILSDTDNSRSGDTTSTTTTTTYRNNKDNRNSDDASDSSDDAFVNPLPRETRLPAALRLLGGCATATATTEKTHESDAGNEDGEEGEEDAGGPDAAVALALLPPGMPARLAAPFLLSAARRTWGQRQRLAMRSALLPPREAGLAVQLARLRARRGPLVTGGGAGAGADSSPRRQRPGSTTNTPARGTDTAATAATATSPQDVDASALGVYDRPGACAVCGEPLDLGPVAFLPPGLLPRAPSSTSGAVNPTTTTTTGTRTAATALKRALGTGDNATADAAAAAAAAGSVVDLDFMGVYAAHGVVPMTHAECLETAVPRE